MIAARALVAAVAAIWRGAGALDAALWRGVKIAGRGASAAVAAVARRGAEFLTDIWNWLPSRAGRAYTSVSGVILVVASLWIIDELRAASAALGASGADLLGPPVNEDDPIVAKVDGRYVHLSDVRAAAVASGALAPGDALTVKTAFERKLVESYVDERLLARAATEAGVQRNPDVARQIAFSRDRILAAAYMQERIATSVTDAAARRLYNETVDATRAGEEVKVRDIVVATEEDALAIAGALDNGADFDTLARSLSLDANSRARGGDLGYIRRDASTDATLAAIAFSTEVGARAAPFQNDAGWHVLEVLDRRRGGGVAFGAVKDEVKRFLRLKAIDQLLTGLKEDSEVVYYSGAPDQVQATKSIDSPP